MALIYNERTGMFDDVSNPHQTSSAVSLQDRLNSAERKLVEEQKKVLVAQSKASQFSSRIEELESLCGKLHFFYITVIVALLVFGLYQCNGRHEFESQNRTLHSNLSNLEFNNNNLRSRNANLENQNSRLSSSNNEMSSALSIIKSNMPLILGNILVRNENENYDTWIYSGNTTYINPKVEIFSLIDGNVDIYVRLYKPDGDYSKGSSSPYSYSYKDNFNLKKNKTTSCTFSGWGGSDKGHWKSGTYRFEFFYRGKSIGSKWFTIY